MTSNYVLLPWRMSVAVCARIYIHEFCTYVCACVCVCACVHVCMCACVTTKKKGKLAEIGRNRHASTPLPGSVIGAPD